MGEKSGSEGKGVVLQASELAKLLANFGAIEFEDVVIKAKKLIIKPVKKEG